MKLSLAFGVAASAVIAASASAQDRSALSVVGSSTVFPFASVVLERFQEATGTEFTIESTGSGGGLNLFCSGVGTEFPDITNASRKIKDSEKELCAENGVTDVTEYVIGFDGIVLANAVDAPALDLTRAEVFMALNATLVIDGETVDNPYSSWNEINADLPAMAIEVLGPPTTSGTRDAFEELVLEEAADALGFEGEISIRTDGAFIEAGENDNLMVRQLADNADAVGIFGYSFLDNNRDSIKGAFIEGVAPEFDAIAAGDYPVSRSLQFYVKNQHIGVIAGTEEYVAEFTSEDAVGAEGYLSEIGLIPLPDGAIMTKVVGE